MLNLSNRNNEEPIFRQLAKEVLRELSFVAIQELNAAIPFWIAIRLREQFPKRHSSILQLSVLYVGKPAGAKRVGPGRATRVQYINVCDRSSRNPQNTEGVYDTVD